MKFTIDRKRLLPVFQLIASNAAKRDVKPVMQEVHLVADLKTKSITLSSFGGDTFAQKRIFDIDSIESDGEVMLPVKKCNNLFPLLNDGNIEIESDKPGSVTIKQNDTEALFCSCDHSEFISFGQAETFITNFSNGELLTATKRTCPAVEADNTKYSLGAICVEAWPNSISFVATDGRRLHLQKFLPRDCWPETGKSILLSPKALLFASKLFADDNDSAIRFKLLKASRDGLEKGEAQWNSFDNGTARVISLDIEGRYPRWRNIVSPVFDEKPSCITEAGALLRMTKLASVGTSDKNPGVLYRFRPGQISAESNTEGNAVRSSLLVDYQGSEKEARIDPRFLVSGMSTLPGKMPVSLHVKEDGKPISGSSLPDKKPFGFCTDDGFSVVVMPLS